MGYPLTFLTLLVMAMPLLCIFMFGLSSYFLINMSFYLGFGFLLSVMVQLYSLLVLSPTKISARTLPWILLTPFYELAIALMRLYLYVLYVFGTGPVMKYGPNTIKAKPSGTVKINSKL
jgi:hypothetical protein